MIHLFTDFGHEGPYTGEMLAACRRVAPEVPAVVLMADAPAMTPRPAAYLLAALATRIPPGDVVVAVVDPGVGGDRQPLALQADGRWLVGPDNGLFELILRATGQMQSHAIRWRPATLSASFHGRDLFAPTAARLARGDRAGLVATAVSRRLDWPDDLAEILYVDRYGNAWTGLRARQLGVTARIQAAGHLLERGRTFVDAPAHAAFWYENSSGLAEIARNGGSAAMALDLTVGAAVRVVP